MHAAVSDVCVCVCVCLCVCVCVCVGGGLKCQRALPASELFSPWAVLSSVKKNTLSNLCSVNWGTLKRNTSTPQSSAHQHATGKVTNKKRPRHRHVSERHSAGRTLCSLNTSWDLRMKYFFYCNGEQIIRIEKIFIRERSEIFKDMTATLKGCIMWKNKLNLKWKKNDFVSWRQIRFFFFEVSSHGGW